MQSLGLHGYPISSIQSQLPIMAESTTVGQGEKKVRKLNT